MPDLLSALRDLGPHRLAALAAWKLRLRTRRARDRRDGYRRLVGRGDRWARQWLEEWGADGFGRWIRRPGAGRLWIEPDRAADWCRESCTDLDLEIARASAAGTFDLLGSGPVDLGTPPEWRRDLYTGLEWPLDEASRLEIVRGDGSDVRTVWELSRGYHFIALARAYWSTGDDTFRDVFVRHVESWLDQNPVGYGPHWASPMDAAIRSANWVLAATLFADADGIEPRLWARLLASVRATSHYVWRYREWHPLYRGNHYVANMVGLVYSGALFADDPMGERWLRRGARALNREILLQVHDDGVSFEGSLAYHRLVTELFAYAGEVIRRSAPRYWTDDYRSRLRRMYRFIATYMPTTGEAPMIGDADDGRLHAVSAELFRHPRRHLLGLPGDWWPGEEPTSAAFPEGGFYVIRDRDDHCILRCGPVGLHGAGSHDHNDQLSLELVVDGERILLDSGTYCYTRDLEARYRFRSTAAHNVVQVGDQEQNPISVDRPWRVLEDRTRSRCTRWEVGEDEVVFEGEHSGFDPDVSVSRRIVYSRGSRSWRIVDRVSGEAVDAVARFHFPDEVVVRPHPAPDETGSVLDFGALTIRWEDGAKPRLERNAVCSARYGGSTACVRVVVSLPGGRLSTMVARRAGPEGGSAH